MTCPRIRSPRKEDCCDELRINPLPLLTRGPLRRNASGLPDTAGHGQVMARRSEWSTQTSGFGGGGRERPSAREPPPAKHWSGSRPSKTELVGAELRVYGRCPQTNRNSTSHKPPSRSRIPRLQPVACASQVDDDESDRERRLPYPSPLPG